MTVVAPVADATRARVALAEVVQAILEVPTVPTVPGTPRANTAFIHPARGVDYLDFVDEAATFERPALFLGATLIAPTGAWEKALDWIDDKVSNLQAGLLQWTDPLLPAVRRPWIRKVGEPGILDAGANLLAVVLTFTPVYLAELSS